LTLALPLALTLTLTLTPSPDRAPGRNQVKHLFTAPELQPAAPAKKAADLPRPPVISPDLPRSPPTATDLLRMRACASHPISPDLPQGFISVGQKFMTDLKELIGTLESTDISYVRCMKSNLKMQPRLFEPAAVRAKARAARASPRRNPPPLPRVARRLRAAHPAPSPSPSLHLLAVALSLGLGLQVRAAGTLSSLKFVRKCASAPLLPTPPTLARPGVAAARALHEPLLHHSGPRSRPRSPRSG
jgi:hypothetical protein